MLPGTEKIHPIYLTLQLLTIPLRFILIAPTVGYQGLIINHDLLVKSNEMFHNGTYDRNIAVGQHLARNWGTWAFFWNLGAWLFTGLLHPPLHIPITGVDVMITIGLSRATYTQRTYIPQSKNACHGTSSFLTERPPGVNESFFVAGARLNGTATTPTNLCKTFVEEWQYGVSLCFFYALLSFVGIVAFLGTVRHTKQQTLALGNAMSGCFVVCGKCLLAMPQLLLLLLPCLLYHTPVFFFRHSPMRVKAPVRTARRYTVKTALGVEQKTEIALKELQTELAKRREDVGRYQGHQGSPTPLADFLGVYDMLIMVNMYLHYADVLALSSVSRSVRNSVLPAADLYRRLAIFKQYTCEDRQRSLCWTCPNQICAGCYQMPLVPQTPIVYHLESCIPYCKPCYYKHVAQAPPKKKQDKHRSVECKCAPKLDNKPSFYNRYINVLRKPRGTGQTREMLERGVCRECNKLTSEELAVKKSEAAKFMLKRGLKDNGEIWTMCARRGCQNRLGSGPRFWICLRRHCEKECTSSLHQAWGGNGKGAEGEVGDEAV